MSGARLLDDLARALVEPMPRRGALRLLGASVAALAVPGLIASRVASGADWIASLVEEALGGLGRSSGLPVGAEAPAIELDRLDGGRASVPALVDGPTVVMFWNPGCGYCRSLHGDVRAWEDERPEGAPALVVVSAGDAGETREEGFAAPVLLDGSWEAAGAFGADGTPMAVLVDRAGRIATPLITGAEAILGVLGTRPRVGLELEQSVEPVNDKESMR